MRRLGTLSWLVGAALLAGCSPGTALLRVDARHPASARAPEAPPARLAGLRPDEFDRAGAAEESGADGDSSAPMPMHREHPSPDHRHQGAEPTPAKEEP